MNRGILYFLCAVLAATSLTAAGREAISWRTPEGRVDADIEKWTVPQVLQQISAATGWLVYLDPSISETVSVRFKNLAPREALSRLLYGMSFAVIPETNATRRLFVFRNSISDATRPIAAPSTNSNARIRNELIVMLKAESREKIDALARASGGKVTGRLDALNAFRLQFDDEASANSARDQFARNGNVETVDNNYAVERPVPAEPAALGASAAFNLHPVAGGDPNRLVIGLIDTAVQPTGTAMDAFLLRSLVVPGAGTSDSQELTHGTSMFETVLRGLAVASAQEGSSRVGVVSVDVYGRNPSSSTFDVAYGIFLAVNDGANLINLSLGSPGDSQVLHQVIQDAQRQGVIFFAAAGNSPTTAATYPAAYPEVTAVTAGDRYGNIASYANRGAFVDLVGPGTSLIQFRSTSYFVTGTSASTAYATGLAAALAERSRARLSEIPAVLRRTLPVPVR